MSTPRPRRDKTPLILLGVLLCGIAAAAGVLLVAGGLWLAGKGTTAVGVSLPETSHKLDAAKFAELQQAFRASPTDAGRKYLGHRYEATVEVLAPPVGGNDAALLIPDGKGSYYVVVVRMKPGNLPPLAVGRYTVAGTLSLFQPDGGGASLGFPSQPVAVLEDATASRH